MLQSGATYQTGASLNRRGFGRGRLRHQLQARGAAHRTSSRGCSAYRGLDGVVGPQAESRRALRRGFNHGLINNIVIVNAYELTLVTFVSLLLLIFLAQLLCPLTTGA